MAFQNKVAFAMAGTTLHNGADIPYKENTTREHRGTNVDTLYSKNEALRWIFIDEISMVADRLLGQVEQNLSAAAIHQRKKRNDNTDIIFGGYNILMFGDWWQLPPIPGSRALFLPPSTWSLQHSPAYTNDSDKNGKVKNGLLNIIAGGQFSPKVHMLRSLWSIIKKLEECKMRI